MFILRKMFGRFRPIDLPFSKLQCFKKLSIDSQTRVSTLTALSQQELQRNKQKSFTRTGFSYNIKDNYVELKATGWKSTLKLSLDWLRDSCQCAVCRDATSGLRFEPLPNGIAIRGIEFDEDQITFTWPDEHRTEIKFSWLWKNHVMNHRKPSCVMPMKTFWDGTGSLKLTPVDYDDIMKTEDAVRHCLHSILEYGVAIVEKVPTNDQNTRLVMERFGPIWPTFWGEIYHVVADLTVHSHPSYTAGDLGLHTDTNYYFEGAGLQAFHVIEHTGTGGTNKLVDGFHVVQKIKSEHPDVYEYLSTKTFSFKYIANQKLHLVNEDTILKHHPGTNELIQIRFSPYDFDTFRTVPQEDVTKHYRALHILRNEVDNPNNAHLLQLSPGKLLVTDNWRVLHGRSSFTGKRVLCGMYVSRSNFLSKARKLGLM